jgi:hypothetical protein
MSCEYKPMFPVTTELGRYIFVALHPFKTLDFKASDEDSTLTQLYENTQNEL